MTPSEFHLCAPARLLLSALLLFFLGFAGGGCLSKPALKHQTFLFQSPPPGAAVAKNGPVLAIRSVTVAAPFSQPAFVYRLSDQAYETDAYARFLVAPETAIALAARAHLLGSGRFQDVIERGKQIKPGKSLEIAVSDLYGDFRQPGQPTAVLSVRVCWLDAGLHKDYSRRIPLKENTAAAVMAGWDAALGEIMAEVAADSAKP